MNRHPDDSAATEGVARPEDDSVLSLRIVHHELVATVPLPTHGAVVVGRGAGADVRIEDRSISRRHAVIHAGAPLTIEDCGSANGTQVGGARLEPGRLAELRPGMIVQLGSVRAFVQRGTVGRPRRVGTIDEIVQRLAVQCERASGEGASFALAQVRVRGMSRDLVEPALRAASGPDDVLAADGAGSYAVLFARAGRAQAADALFDLAGRLRREGATVECALAVYPHDGGTAAALMAHVQRSPDRAPAPKVEGGPAVTSGAQSELARLRPLIARVAVGTIPVLVCGETGAGKEVVANAIHAGSPRAGKPFVRLNCAALSEHLLESELFGHERGAFTGAHQAKPGLLEVATGGTVFLDEIGDLPLPMQAKLLRVVEERAVLRVGGLSPRPVDVRFITATNRDLEADVEAGRFRRDLFFRLNGVVIEVRPLRERVGEIAELARLFVNEAARAANVAAPAIALEALARLESHAWPGNVRELRNVMERAVLLCAGDTIGVEHLPVERFTHARAVGAEATSSSPSPLPERHVPVGNPREEPPGRLRDEIAGLERERLLDALARCAGNQTLAAKMLGISRGTLMSRLEAYGVPRPRKKRE